MLAKTALLIVTNPKQIGKILPSVRERVKKTLYIQLLSALSDPFGSFYPQASWPKYSKTVHGIYSQAATHCQNLDVRVLLSGLKYTNLSKIQTNRNIDLVIFDRPHNESEIEDFITKKVANITEKCDIVTLDSGEIVEHTPEEPKNEKTYKHCVLGGTFDRLHIAHKLLLSEAALRSTCKVTIGITDVKMTHSKLLWELIQDIETRTRNVQDFLTDICRELQFNLVPISDPFGPSIVDPTMDLIVVSDETIRGGEKINEIRTTNGLSPLDVLPIQLVDDPNPSPIEESKISSSNNRIRLLGTLLKPVIKNPTLPTRPYVIGLTGGVASGKTGVGKWLDLHGAETVNCDLIGHQVYKAGKPCHELIVQHFGDSVLGEDGEINRKELGNIVFKNPDQMQKLNSLVWPAIAREVEELICNCKSRVIVIEAAILSSAGWSKLCHEVWVTLVPPSEAIERLKSRNGLSEEQAKARLAAQVSNDVYVQSAHVVFSTLWAPEYTKEQVDRAWELLQKRI